MAKKKSLVVKPSVIIIGGGLSGLTAAIHLRMNGVEVRLIEKNSYPHHKVCGEYISNEVLPYLSSLNIDPFKLGAKAIGRMLISNRKGKTIESALPLGGFGISRYRLDSAMHELATNLGLETIHDTVTECHYADGHMQICTKSGLELSSKLVIGAFGKRSLLDKKLERDHLKEDASYLAVKAHFKGEFPNDLVALHNFKGGYCGISRVEKDLINVCYITEFSSFKPHKDIENFQENVMYENPHLREFFNQAHPVFEEPLAISQISFADKESVNDHVLMCGDSAGLIHPLCGNGMSMAIRGAKLLSEAILSTDLTNGLDRHYLEESYSSAWKQTFSARLNRGRQLARVFSSDRAAELMLVGLRIAPAILPRIISSTHGRPMKPISL